MTRKDARDQQRWNRLAHYRLEPTPTLRSDLLHGLWVLPLVALFVVLFAAVTK